MWKFVDSENPEDRSYLEIIHGFYKKRRFEKSNIIPLENGGGFRRSLNGSDFRAGLKRIGKKERNF